MITTVEYYQLINDQWVEVARESLDDYARRNVSEHLEVRMKELAKYERISVNWHKKEFYVMDCKLGPIKTMKYPPKS